MDPITYGTVCSGIEAPSVAWEGLGWRPTFFSEIETFPRQVLHQRQRAVDAARTGAAQLGVPLWGDFTAMRMRFFRRLGIRLPDVLCGGTPCQAFSLAGLRQSLDDARGNLTLEYVRLANAIDNKRRRLGRGGNRHRLGERPWSPLHQGQRLRMFPRGACGRRCPSRSAIGTPLD